MRNLLRAWPALACALVLFLAPYAAAGALVLPEAVWVCPGGDCGHAGAEYAAIQAAVDAVAPGGLVRIAAGAYEGGIVLNKSVTL